MNPKSDPLVSIIVPIYNAEAYLNYCLVSIQKQTYKNLDIILVNDGSTDSSSDICLELAKNDDRIHYFVKENSGPSATRNYGLGKAKGDYLLFVDADDVLLPNAVETCVQASHESKAGMVIFTFERIDVKGDVLNHGDTEESAEFPKSQTVSAEQAVRWLLLGRFQNYIWRLFAERPCWDGIVFPMNRSFLEDAQVYPFVLLQSGNVTFINKALYQYRITPGSLVSHEDPLHMTLQKDEVFAHRRETLCSVRPTLAPYCDAERFFMEFRCMFSTLRYHHVSSSEQERWKLAERYIRNHKIPRWFHRQFGIKGDIKVMLAKIGLASSVR